MSIRARLIRIIVGVVGAVRSEPTIDNLDKKRKNFLRVGFLMRPIKHTETKRIKISGINVDVITNSEKKPKNTLIYMHGGGFVYGGNKPHLRMLSLLAKYSNSVIYAVDHSVAPEYKYPVALNELISVYDKLSEEHESIAVAGDSSGGNLVFCMVIKLRNEKKKLPSKVLLLGPATDATLSNKWMTDPSTKDPFISASKIDFFLNAYVPERMARKDPRISPYFADLNDLPPIFIQVGGSERMYGDGYLAHRKILESGGSSELHVGKGMWHAWQLFANYMPESNQAIRNMAEFINN